MKMKKKVGFKIIKMSWSGIQDMSCKIAQIKIGGDQKQFSFFKINNLECDCDLEGVDNLKDIHDLEDVGNLEGRG